MGVCQYAALRGLAVKAFESLGCTGEDGEVHIPMRDLTGQVTGWRRRKADGSLFPPGKHGKPCKAKSVYGSKPGLFYRYLIADTPHVIVCEGEIDTLAALSAGEDAIGTPGCSPAKHLLPWLVILVRGREAILAPDPGESGLKWLRKVGTALIETGIKVRVIPPSDGDLDKRLHCGPNLQISMQALIEAAVPWVENSSNPSYPLNPYPLNPYLLASSTFTHDALPLASAHLAPSPATFAALPATASGNAARPPREWTSGICGVTYCKANGYRCEGERENGPRDGRLRPETGGERAATVFALGSTGIPPPRGQPNAGFAAGIPS
ncbi:MAG: toprim domain-containing protein [bacterium]|nr:toprim domain-containing protein [bacterium]